MQIPPNYRPIFLPSGGSRSFSRQQGGGLGVQGIRSQCPTVFQRLPPPSGQIPPPTYRQSYGNVPQGHQRAFAIRPEDYTSNFPALVPALKPLSAPTPPMATVAKTSKDSPDLRSTPTNPLNGTLMFLDTGCVPNSVGNDSIKPAFVKSFSTRKVPVLTAKQHSSSINCERGKALIQYL